MKFRDLIRDTVWIPSAERAERERPVVSVLMAVRRQNAEQVSSSIRSFLTQTHRSLEVIAVDDSGADAIESVLEHIQRSDGRLQLLRHATPIGLVAVCWQEALRYARGKWLVLADDCDRFDSKAIQLLIDRADEDAGSVCFGHIEAIEDDNGLGPSVFACSDSAASLVALNDHNWIPTAAVLLPRRAIEQVGFVDPHVILGDEAAWDLWRRLSQRFDMRAVDVACGTRVQCGREGGPAVDRWAIEEWMRTARNAKLMPEAIDDYDVLACDPNHGRSTREACADLAGSYGWADIAAERAVAPSVESGETSGEASIATSTLKVIRKGPILVVNVQHDASTTLYFDRLPEPFSHRIRVMRASETADMSALARASCVIFVRALRTFRPWIDSARALGLPIYYFLDDNMPHLVEQGEVRMNGEDFSPGQFRKELEIFDGVLLSSRPLLEYFRERDLHRTLYHFPVAWSDQAPFAVEKFERSDDETVFAFAGGLHRSPAVWEIVLPALTRLANDGVNVHFVAPGMRSSAEIFDDLPVSMRVTLLPYDHGYEYAMRRFARHSPDFMLLAPSKSSNNMYKTQHPLLSAALLDTVAILPAVEPYEKISDGSVAVMVDEPFDIQGWYVALKRAVTGQIDTAGIRARNRKYCAEHFSGAENVNVLAALLDRAELEPSWPAQNRRLAALIEQFPAGGAAGDEIQRAASELVALRRMRRYSWRHRLLARPSDLWDDCGPAFWPLQRDSLAQGWKTRRATLEFSDSLHDVPYREYSITLPACVLAGVALAFAVDWVKEGEVQVQLISPESKVVASAKRSLGVADISQPVHFAWKPVRVNDRGLWRIRVSCRSRGAVYVYELTNRRGLNMFYGPPSPFMELLTHTPAAGDDAVDFGDDAQVESSLPGAHERPLKLIIEGDIATNQIIERLLQEAFGSTREVEKVNLLQFGPHTLYDGGLPLLSRTASAAALPMLTWMIDRKIPFLYYIDDNFWELTGNSPLAQFYQCASVRRTMKLAVAHADRVIVNAPRLGRYIKERFPQANIVELNAPFDFSLIDRLPDSIKPMSEVRIGFAGSITRARDFDEVVPALVRILAKYPQVSLTFFGYCPPELAGEPRVTFVRHVAGYAEFIELKHAAALDIGLAPMADTPANLYKTNNKYREYGALKVAGIYTRASPYTESVEEGRTGLLVSHTSDAWYEALERLITDTQLRHSIANAAYEDVRARYAQSVVAREWKEMLDEFAQRYVSRVTRERLLTPDTRSIRMRRWVGHTRLRATVLTRRAYVRMRSLARAPQVRNR